MNRLEARLDRLEAKAPADVTPWELVIWDPDCETLEEAKARDLPPGFDGHVTIVRLVAPGSVRKELARHE
ncbi:MAG: hypothetical protein WCL08_05660 [Verrucomicrobiota bacterium]